MLSSIRKFSTSWYAKILLGIIVIPFVFWGMGGVFTGGNKNVVVVIDKDKFSTQEFANFVRSQHTANEKINSERIDQFLSTFIGSKLIEKEYNNFGIKLSDNSLSKLIKIQKEFKKKKNFLVQNMKNF
jgi:peptidyl-prolyl cis-trans isomerase D